MRNATLLILLVVSCTSKNDTPAGGMDAGTAGIDAGTSRIDAGAMAMEAAVETAPDTGIGPGSMDGSNPGSTDGGDAAPFTDGDGPPATTDGATPSMTFFVTSTGSGAMGGNLGGLAGADMKCQTLAPASARTWHAYLSTATANARDRIGSGPWYNFRGEKIADSLAALHTCDPTGAPGGLELCAPFDYRIALTEIGDIPPPNEHDILTGSDQSGMAVSDTCQDWTSSSDTDFGQVGHVDASDTAAVRQNVLIYIWNGAHVSRGCSPASLMGTGGSGRLYCFAIN